jgi:hypothetical protein
MDITPATVKTWLKLSGSNMTRDLLVIGCDKFEMQIVRKGKDNPFVVYPAFSKTDHEVSFYWDDEFLAAAPGLYLGDVYVNDGYCFTVKFRIKKCDIAVVECRTENEAPCSPCEEGCDDGEGCLPVDVVETISNTQGCEETCNDC